MIEIRNCVSGNGEWKKGETDLRYNKVNLKKKPAVNVLSNDDFQERVRLVFEIVADILGKSFGPYGAPTLISDYPHMEATKDGFTIARSITFDDTAGSQLDRIIYRAMMDICGRVNYSVGDGTTTAIIATYELYKEILKVDELKDLSSREIMEILAHVKDQVIEKLQEEIVPVTEENMIGVVRHITYTSSNADEEITDLITSAYEEFRYPVLRCDVSDSPKTYIEKSTGYKSKVWLGDNIYINSRNNIGTYGKANVLIFDYQVRDRTYEKIIRPLAEFTRVQKGAGMVEPLKLICIAPSYDDVTLHIKIRQDIINEYKATKDFSLIVMAYSKNTEVSRKSIYDLAMLLNTEVIERSKEQEIIDALTERNVHVSNLINIGGADRDLSFNALYETALITIQRKQVLNTPSDYRLRAGYADKLEGGIEESVFQVSAYDKDLYEKFKDDAKKMLDDTIEKYAILGTYTTDVYDAQYRYISLLMKTATVYVGGNSKLSRDMRLTAVEDAVRATESAYKYGYVQGGNVTLLRAIDTVMEYTSDDAQKAILEACRNAFIAVYHKVFENYGKYSEEDVYAKITGSIDHNEVFDLRTGEYTKEVINSAKTDMEVLTATVDLLGILLSGNQMLVSQYRHDNDD